MPVRFVPAATPLEDRYTPTPVDLLATLTDPVPEAGRRTGPVAVDGTFVVVGAAGTQFDGLVRGAAYVYDTRTGAAPLVLDTPATAAVPSDVGWSVAASGDRVVVSGSAAGGQTGGAEAYVFDATTGALRATLRTPGPLFADYLLVQVAAAGNRGVVGTYGRTQSDQYFGGAYVFDLDTGGLVATLADPAPSSADDGFEYFGLSVAAAGDRAIVAASWEDVGGVDAAGAVYVFDLETGTLSEP